MTSPDRVDLREKVAAIVEGAIADSIGGDWDDARDEATSQILALIHNVSGKEDEGRQTINDPQCADEGTLPSLAPGAGVSGEGLSNDPHSDWEDAGGEP